MRKRAMLTAGTMFLATTMIWAAYQGQPNYPVLVRYTAAGTFSDARTIEFLGYSGPVSCSVQVFTSQDVPLDCNVPGHTAVRVAKVPDPNGTGWLTEYVIDANIPDPNLWLVDVIATDTSSRVRPQIRVGRGIVQALPLDPHYDYTLASTDPREHQKAVKVTQRYWFVQGITIPAWAYNVRFMP